MSTGWSSSQRQHRSWLREQPTAAGPSKEVRSHGGPGSHLLFFVCVFFFARRRHPAHGPATGELPHAAKAAVPPEVFRGHAPTVHRRNANEAAVPSEFTVHGADHSSEGAAWNRSGLRGKGGRGEGGDGGGVVVFAGGPVPRRSPSIRGGVKVDAQQGKWWWNDCHRMVVGWIRTVSIRRCFTKYTPVCPSTNHHHHQKKKPPTERGGGNEERARTGHCRCCYELRPHYYYGWAAASAALVASSISYRLKHQLPPDGSSSYLQSSCRLVIPSVRASSSDVVE